MSSSIKDVNRIPEILEVMKELGQTKLHVGVMAPEGSDLWIIAMVNEYGASINVTPRMRAYLHYQGLHLKDSTRVIKIPERSYIRSGFESSREDIERLVERSLPLVLKLKMPVEQFYGVIGEFCVGRIREYIQRLRSPSNHPFTVAGKKSSHPLINTGRLNQSISYRVVKE